MNCVFPKGVHVNEEKESVADVISTVRVLGVYLCLCVSVSVRPTIFLRSGRFMC